MEAAKSRALFVDTQTSANARRTGGMHKNVTTTIDTEVSRPLGGAGLDLVRVEEGAGAWGRGRGRGRGHDFFF